MKRVVVGVWVVVGAIISSAFEQDTITEQTKKARRIFFIMTNSILIL